MTVRIISFIKQLMFCSLNSDISSSFHPSYVLTTFSVNDWDMFVLIFRFRIWKWKIQSSKNSFSTWRISWPAHSRHRCVRWFGWFLYKTAVYIMSTFPECLIHVALILSKSSSLSLSCCVLTPRRRPACRPPLCPAVLMTSPRCPL